MRVRTRTVVSTALVLMAVHLIAAPAANAASMATALYTFKGSHADDGANPDGGLIFDKAGNLYSTVGGGGKEGNGGAVYELSPRQGGGSPWTETLLHTFPTFTRTDGSGPSGGVIFDSAGDLYGMAAGGGASNNGVVYKLHPAAGGGWTESVLYSFAGGSDGAQPAGGLIFDQAGNLYGVGRKNRTR